MNTMITICLSEAALLLLLVIVVLINHLAYDYKNNYYKQVADKYKNDNEYLLKKLKQYEGKKK